MKQILSLIDAELQKLKADSDYEAIDETNHIFEQIAGAGIDPELMAQILTSNHCTQFESLQFLAELINAMLWGDPLQSREFMDETIYNELEMLVLNAKPNELSIT